MTVTPHGVENPYESEVVQFRDETGEDTLCAHFTSRNGIRVDIQSDGGGPDWACFQFTADQADHIADFLRRSAEKYRRWDGPKP